MNTTKDLTGAQLDVIAFLRTLPMVGPISIRSESFAHKNHDRLSAPELAIEARAWKSKRCDACEEENGFAVRATFYWRQGAFYKAILYIPGYRHVESIVKAKEKLATAFGLGISE